MPKNLILAAGHVFQHPAKSAAFNLLPKRILRSNTCQKNLILAAGYVFQSPARAAPSILLPKRIFGSNTQPKS